MVPGESPRTGSFSDVYLVKHPPQSPVCTPASPLPRPCEDPAQRSVKRGTARGYHVRPIHRADTRDRVVSRGKDDGTSMSHRDLGGLDHHYTNARNVLSKANDRATGTQGGYRARYRYETGTGKVAAPRPAL